MRDSYSLYSILGLNRRAHSEEIKAAYWTLAKRSHPDINGGGKEAEWRTKEINRAYETLGDPQARVAYDLEMARQRAKARRRFWSAAATGAVTFMLTVGCALVTVMWRQQAEIHRYPNSEPTLLTRSARTESVADPSSENSANQTSVRLADPERRDVFSAPVSPPHMRPSGDPPKSQNSEIASVPMRDGHALLALSEPVAQSSARFDRPPKEEIANPPSSALVSDVPLPDGQPVPRTELANAVSSEVDVKRQMPAAREDQESSGKSTPRVADRKTTVVGRIHRKSGEKFDTTETGRTAIASKRQGLEQEPGFVARTATALRWPSADEPFVNLGMRNK
jgi:curved DNA-binding protein CbpA